jgi:hypothetical protein
MARRAETKDDIVTSRPAIVRSDAAGLTRFASYSCLSSDRINIDELCGSAAFVRHRS